jgi:DNA helicase-2/ATP-dependent DNA helicase PcrA
VVGVEENLFPSYMSLATPDQIDEERRLFYVAITRAEEHLTLSLANSRYQYGSMKFNEPSRFIEEIGEENLDPLYSITKPDQNRGFREPKILGNFKPKGLTGPKKAIDLSNFSPDPFKSIKEGHSVLHQKFGKGFVKSIDERDVATIVFEDLYDNQEKRIMLKYAKLQIIED